MPSEAPSPPPSGRMIVAGGQVLFREGQPGDNAYIIVRGQVEITTSDAGRETVITTLGPGELFGEMALIDGHTRIATATTVGECELTVINRRDVEEKIAQADPLVATLLRVILERFREIHRLAHLWVTRYPG